MSKFIILFLHSNSTWLHAATQYTGKPLFCFVPLKQRWPTINKIYTYYISVYILHIDSPEKEKYKCTIILAYNIFIYANIICIILTSKFANVKVENIYILFGTCVCITTQSKVRLHIAPASRRLDNKSVWFSPLVVVVCGAHLYKCKNCLRKYCVSAAKANRPFKPLDTMTNV